MSQHRTVTQFCATCGQETPHDQAYDTLANGEKVIAFTRCTVCNTNA